MKKDIIRRIALVTVGTLAVGMLAGCGGESKSSSDSETSGGENEIKVGFSIQDISNESWSEMYAHMQEKAEELGVTLTLSDCQGDSSKQVSSLENFIEGDYDVIIAHCFDAKAATSVLESAQDKGIKIIAYDTKTEVYDAYFGLDNYEVGKQIAKNCADWLEEKFDGEEVEVGIANYPLNQVCLDREEGIVDGIAEYYPNAEVVASAQAGYTDEGLEVGENFVQGYPDMKAVMGIDDAGLLGIYQAFNAAGKTGDDIGLFGIDALDEALDLISQGGIFRSTINLDLNKAGEDMVQTAVDMVEGKEVEKEVYFDMVTVTEENAQTVIDGKSQS